MAAEHELLVTLEENSLMAGAGSAVSEFLNQQGTIIPMLQLGLTDRYVDHAKHSEQLAAEGLDSAGIEASIRQRLGLMGLKLSSAI